MNILRLTLKGVPALGILLLTVIFLAEPAKIQAQVEVSVLKDTVRYTEPVKYTIINNDSISYCCEVQLEKYDSRAGFKLYSRNVITPYTPGTKGIGPVCKSNTQCSDKFVVPQSDSLINETYYGTRKAKNSDIVLDKQGIFRLRVNYYPEPHGYKPKTTYSKTFVITNKRRKKR
ncbi:MAG: hypothetical protein ACI30N_08145 [Muribaculaceae bacterium]